MYWLPEDPEWIERSRSISASTGTSWGDLVSLANARLDMLKTNRLDKIVRQKFPRFADQSKSKAIRLAVLGSSTFDHLVPAIRVAGVRRSMWFDVFIGDYGQYLSELLSQDSELSKYSPNTVLFCFDAIHLFSAADPSMDTAQADALLDEAAGRIGGLWRLARERFGAQVIQQTILPAYPSIAGSNEFRIPGSPANLVTRMNERLRVMAASGEADLLDIEQAASHSGLTSWCDPVLWHRAKQEISPAAAPYFGDLVARLVAAHCGLSFKCLVLDLDNTLWGGVIGDDGLEGIHLGQGSALGEAHLAFQSYCRYLSRRGVILAVCSKNDEQNARAPFDSHPDMLLRHSDIACFVANWNDKPSNIRSIAQRLNIGLDAIAFADDNPFERNIVRRELPMVAVPELPEDPALYASCIADAGYFEVIQLTDEDRQRTQQYQANLKRDEARNEFTDMAGYLRSLDMRLDWKAFDGIGLPRIVQLINKTNQFNLTTRRYAEADVQQFMNDPAVVSLQLRLTDRLGDNGMISVVIGRLEGTALNLDTWLMSCRVLGRQVEQATMNLVCDLANQKGATKIIGQYVPTAKNGMVREHYKNLGFRHVADDNEGGSTWELELARFDPFETHIFIEGNKANG